MKQIKCIFLGDMSVGKTSILCRLKRRDMNPPSTIGVDTVFYQRDEYKIICWDTAGQDKFEIITASFLRSATFAIYVYDVNNIKSFEKACYWYEKAKKTIRGPSEHVLVGNKTDLPSVVTHGMVSEIFGTTPHLKCSTVSDDDSVVALFDHIIQRSESNVHTYEVIDLVPPTTARTSCCCIC